MWVQGENKQSSCFPGLDESEWNFITMRLGNASSAAGCPNKAGYSTCKTNTHVLLGAFQCIIKSKGVRGRTGGQFMPINHCIMLMCLLAGPWEDQLIYAHIASKKHKVYCQMCGGLPVQVTCFILALFLWGEKKYIYIIGLHPPVGKHLLKLALKEKKEMLHWLLHWHINRFLWLPLSNGIHENLKKSI